MNAVLKSIQIYSKTSELDRGWGWRWGGWSAANSNGQAISKVKVEQTCFSPLQYSCLENPRDRGAWWAAVHGVAMSWIRLSNFTFTFHFHALEKEMATHSRVLAWRIPGTGEPGGLLSMGSHRVRHDWSDLAAAAADLFLKKFILLPRWAKSWVNKLNPL